MNFVIELFESKDFNAILMIIDRLTKMHHYISCITTEKNTNAEKTARLLIDQV
jgi:phosphoketolase